MSGVPRSAKPEAFKPTDFDNYVSTLSEVLPNEFRALVRDTDFYEDTEPYSGYWAQFENDAERMWD